MLATTNPAQPTGCRLTPEEHRRWAEFILRAYLERPKPPAPQELAKGGGQ